ncbi:MAG: nicotinate-nucleotide adenylyltransferase [Bacillota bacterium]|nr:nicotinate-nucleotide adenylyltransferase [Bacillota bacterium]
MGESVKRLGIMGGTFNPIHYGHLVTAESARSKFGLDQVIFVPSGHPPHKRLRDNSDAEHRAMMTLLATITNPAFTMSRVELDREGYSYSYDTVNYFREQYGDGTEIFFITGADAILEIFTWKNAAELLRICTFIAATRPGFDLGDVHKLPEGWQDRIQLMRIPALSISSTDIRRRVHGGDTIKYLLPEAVENYILKQGLYL